MLLVFSTDFGQQSSLFFPQHQQSSQTSASDVEAQSTAHSGETFDVEVKETKKNSPPSPVTVQPKDRSNQAQGGDNNPTD